MLDQITGRPCANCETAPARRGPYCSADCRTEYEGVGAYVDDAPYRPLSRRGAAPVCPTAEDGALFSRSELVEAEALRQWKAEQIPGQLDIWDACAETPTEADRAAAVEWPTGGALFDAEQLRGQLTLA